MPIDLEHAVPDASSLNDLGWIDEAIAVYRKALVLDPNFAVAMFNLAGVPWNHADKE